MKSGILMTSWQVIHVLVFYGHEASAEISEVPFGSFLRLSTPHPIPQQASKISRNLGCGVNPSIQMVNQEILGLLWAINVDNGLKRSQFKRDNFCLKKKKRKPRGLFWPKEICCESKKRLESIDFNLGYRLSDLGTIV